MVGTAEGSRGSMTRVLVTGAGGMLGADLAVALRGLDVVALGRDALDITDESAVRRAVHGMDVVVNAAAYTAVDDAETHEEEAWAINALGPRYLARAAKDQGARLLQVSTDYVFDGTATTPYPEDALRNPVSSYGRSKAGGEVAVLEEHPNGSVILRTAWLYGCRGKNFVDTMLTLAAIRDTVSVVDDQIGQPTWTADLAAQIRLVIDSPISSGILHATNSGQVSWWGFAREIFRLGGLDPERVLPTTSDQFLRPAPRPAWSVLGHDAWTRHHLAPLRPWQDALAEAFDTCFRERVTTP